MFNSWMENDTFLQPWEQHLTSYCVPPLGLISQALVHCIKSQATATFVVPDWPSSIWYPILLKLSERIVPVTRKMLTITPLSELSDKFETSSFLVAHLDRKST